MDIPKITNEEEAMAAIRQDGWALQFVPNELMTAEFDHETFRWAGKMLVGHVPGKFCTLRASILYFKAVKRNGNPLYYVPYDLMTTEVCLEAVKQNGRALEYVSENQRTTELCLEAVRQNEIVLIYVPENRRTMEICLEAVKQDGWVLKYVPENQRTMEVCLEAVKQESEALYYVPEGLREEVCRLQ